MDQQKPVSLFLGLQQKRLWRALSVSAPNADASHFASGYITNRLRILQTWSRCTTLPVIQTCPDPSNTCGLLIALPTTPLQEAELSSEPSFDISLAAFRHLPYTGTACHGHSMPLQL